MTLVEALSIYAPNFFAVLASSVALALVGSQLAARSESLQAFVASQSASLGITLGLAAMVLWEQGVDADSILPVFSALFFAVIFYTAGQKLGTLHRSKSSEILVTLFLFSLALNFLITASLPQLETHFSSSFMGDIATASAASSYWLLMLSIIAMLIVLTFMKRVTYQSFWLASSGVDFAPSLRIFFYALCALLIVESTRIFGFLYTSASLVVLPLAVSLVARNLRSFNIQVVALAAASSGLGFLLSLYSTKFSTSASIVATQVLISVAWVLVRKLQKSLCT